MKNKKNKLLKEDHKTIFFFFILEEENKEKEEHLDKEYDDKGRVRRIRLSRMQKPDWWVHISSKVPTPETQVGCRLK